MSTSRATPRVLPSLLGGTHGLAIIPRVAASTFIGIFAIHCVNLMHSLLRDKSFRWFGPDSRMLVDGPSPPMTRRSKVLGLVLIAAGLVLLVLAINGLVTGLEN
jgi:hypothetical protein